MRLKRLSLPTACSMRARALYSIFAKKAGRSVAFDLYGITGHTPRLRQASRFALESYPLSVMAARGAMSGPMSRRTSKLRLSLASPPVK